MEVFREMDANRAVMHINRKLLMNIPRHVMKKTVFENLTLPRGSETEDGRD